jgi:type 1 fimbriae regulatory protein FimB
MTALPPRKLPFFNRRNREFLYLHEVDALIAATRQTRAPIRIQVLVMLLFCQALQPSEICWLRWCDLNKAVNTLLIVRNRSKSLRIQPQMALVNESMIYRKSDRIIT